MTTQFDNIYHERSQQVGKFRMAASGMAWMNNETKEIVSVSAADIKWALWMRVSRNFRLRVGLKEKGKRENFDGFMRDDHDKLTSLFKTHYGVILEHKEVSFKGWNWGATDFQGQDLAFLVSGKTAFELPLQRVANSNIAGRTEVSLEFSPISSRPSKNAPDELMEIRFYVPGTTTKDTGSDAADEDAPDGDGEETSAAQAFHDAIKEKAELGEVSGDVIINFEEVLVLTPRGRYDVDMFPEFLRLRGKTYDYKINYEGISKLFLLPKDDQHVLFILSLVNPIRQGQTRYHFLVMQFDREEEISAELNMADEDVAKYEKLQKRYEATTFEVVSSVFRALSNNKIVGSGSYQSRTGQPGIKANLKAIQGDLFILDKYIFFVAKAPLLIELSDIHSVSFSRVGGQMATSRTFDLKIVTKSGAEHLFSSINKEEHEGVEQYLLSKKLRIKNTMAEEMALPLVDDDDDDDEEMRSAESSDDDAPKARNLDDDDSEEDEDFQASSSDAGSPSSESDSDSDGAASVSDASGDLQIAGGSKKKKGAAKDDDKPKKKKKSGEDGAAAKKKKTKGGDSDSEGEAMDIDEPKPKPKPKAKPKAEETDGPVKKKQKKE